MSRYAADALRRDYDRCMEFARGLPAPLLRRASAELDDLAIELEREELRRFGSHDRVARCAELQAPARRERWLPAAGFLIFIFGALVGALAIAAQTWATR